MKMRKLFAGIAAAATLLGGMALGAASAQADDAATTAGTAAITVKNSQEGHTYAAYKFATGAQTVAGGGGGGGSEAMVQPVMDFELGAVAIGLGGLGMLAAAAMNAKHAITGDFMNCIAGHAPRAVEGVGRAGHAARAVVFAIIGWSLIRAGWLESEGAVKGLGEALLSLRDMGPVYTLVAIGLLLFGAFSLVTARYRIIPDFSRGRLRPHL